MAFRAVSRSFKRRYTYGADLAQTSTPPPPSRAAMHLDRHRTGNWHRGPSIHVKVIGSAGGSLHVHRTLVSPLNPRSAMSTSAARVDSGHTCIHKQSTDAQPTGLRRPRQHEMTRRKLHQHTLGPHHIHRKVGDLADAELIWITDRPACCPQPTYIVSVCC